MYKDDNLTFEDIRMLLARFGNQTLDFFGAIRATTYDDQILCAAHNLCAGRRTGATGSGASLMHTIMATV
jgi:hypothetical protein